MAQKGEGRGRGLSFRCRWTVVMMMPAADVDVVRLAGEPLEKQPKPHAGDHQSQDQAETVLNPLLERALRVAGQERHDNRQNDDDAGMRQRGDQAEEQSMEDGATLTDEICCHQRLAVPWRKGVCGAEEECKEQSQPEAVIGVEDEPQ